MIESVSHNEETLAIIIRNGFDKEGVSFFTPPEYSQQLGYMQHPAGKIIDPHYHNPIERTVPLTQEVLFIKDGILEVSFYDKEQKPLSTHRLFAGDTILLASGGHGFKVIEPVKMIEVKQGPYQADNDKTRFSPKDSRES